MPQYPLSLSFKIVVFNPQVKVTDAAGSLVLYVKQKALALKESVKIYADEAQTTELFAIKANKVIDFSAQYNITTPNGRQIGTVRRQGLRSIWKATYEILDASGNQIGLIHEENAWIKVLDSIVSEIPFAGMFINPAYLVELRGNTVLYLKKQPAFFEGKFNLEQRGPIASAEEESLLLNSIIMMLLLERSRG